MNCEYCGTLPHLSQCPNNHDPPIIGHCCVCGEELLDNGFECFTDNEDNIFCSDDCATEYHGIIEKKWTDDDRKRER